MAHPEDKNSVEGVEQRDGSVQSLMRALDILEALSTEREGLGGH